LGRVLYKLPANQILRIISSGLWATVTVVGVEPFFVPLKVLAALFGFAAHTLIFTCSFIYQIDKFLLRFRIKAQFFDLLFKFTCQTHKLLSNSNHKQVFFNIMAQGVGFEPSVNGEITRTTPLLFMVL
jgi:hypothetical protein